MPPKLQYEETKEEKLGILPSDGVSVDLPATQHGARPGIVRYVSMPTYESPLRHHRRKQSSAREVKETLHARSEYTNSGDDGGAAIHRINQYVIGEEIGRGSFGAVHVGVDQHGVEYAIKEFSKSRLRKRAQSNILRRPHSVRRQGHIAAGTGLNVPLHRSSTSEMQAEEGQENPLFLIKEEIAIMKKLNHGNLVSLIEVLDDPNEDSLYMVLEMCKKGVIMKVGVDDRADPYDDESCRCWFRDLILGIEYLHAQGIVHRDIKPDNLLLTDDDVLKIVDFGVSEMFEKQSEMLTAKSAGSPAFIPPELCVAKHGDISGKAADIWSMGVTLYCLRFGHIPFERAGVLDLYESIKEDKLDMSKEIEVSDDFKDLIYRLLEKQPAERIKMDELRNHPWITKNGRDPLLSAEENTAILIEPPTREETEQAITGNLSNILVLMKAVRRFKQAISHKKPAGHDSILGKDMRIVQPPHQIHQNTKPPLFHKARSVDTSDRRAFEQALVTEGIHRDIDLRNYEGRLEDREDTAVAFPPPTRSSTNRSDNTDPTSTSSHKRDLHADPESHRPPQATSQPRPIPHHDGKGHAHDPLTEHLYLNLGTGGSSRPPSPPTVSESPPAVSIDIYEEAYQREVERIRSSQGRSATLFLTRRVERMSSFLKEQGLVSEDGNNTTLTKTASGGLSKVLDAARKKAAQDTDQDDREHGADDDAAATPHKKPGSSVSGSSAAGSFAKMVETARGMTMGKDHSQQSAAHDNSNTPTEGQAHGQASKSGPEASISKLAASARQMTGLDKRS